MSALDRWNACRDPHDGMQEARHMVFEQRMERDGLKKCDECGDWSSDTVACEREVNMGDSGNGYAFHDVPINAGNLCGECQEGLKATPIRVCLMCDQPWPEDQPVCLNCKR